MLFPSETCTDFARFRTGAKQREAVLHCSVARRTPSRDGRHVTASAPGAKNRKTEENNGMENQRVEVSTNANTLQTRARGRPVPPLWLKR